MQDAGYPDDDGADADALLLLTATCNCSNVSALSAQFATETCPNPSATHVSAVRPACLPNAMALYGIFNSNTDNM